MDVFGGGRAQRGRSSGNGPVGPPKVLILREKRLIWAPPDLCLPRCVFRIAHVSGKAPLPGQGVWQIHNVSALFALQIPWGEKGRYIVYLPDPLSRERGFTRYMGNP